MKRKELIFLLVLFITLLVIGLTVVDDYGVSWDEYRNRINGFFTYNYLINGDYALFNYQDRHYGAAFDLPLIFVEKIMRLRTFRDIFLLRHYATFLFFYFSCLIFYYLSKRLLGSPQPAFVAVALLLVSPRIFTDAFYNSKDIVFMGMFIVSIYTLTLFIQKRTAARALLHAAACAYLVNIRIMGIMVPFLTLFWAAIRMFQDNQIVPTIKRSAVYLAGFAGLTILFWPYLWPDPTGNFIKAFIHMSRFPNIVETLYLGKTFMTNALPWHYLPVWILITIPPVYSLLFFTGVIGISRGLISAPMTGLQENTEDLLVLIWFFGPIIIVTAMGSTLYDGWRQMFFLYPAFVIIAVNGLKMLWVKSSAHGPGWRFFLRAMLVFCLSINMSSVLWFMIKNHPHGNVYFNILAGRNYESIKNNFEMDYWGLAYRQGLEKIVEMDPRDEITVFPANDPGVLNSFILPEKERRRIWYVQTPEKADYYITNYRWQRKPFNLSGEVFSVMVEGAKIVSVFKLDRSVTDYSMIGRFRGLFFDYFDDPSAMKRKDAK